MATDMRKRPLIFGEVLFDRFPDGNRVLGGAPFNVAWHLQAFGARPLFVSRVGDDESGREVKARMAAWAMDTSGLQTDPEHPTGAVSVSYQDGEPSFDILADQAYDFIDSANLPEVADYALLYHGSLALRDHGSRDAFDVLASAMEAPVFVDVNLRDPWWHSDEVLKRMRGARWAKLNEDELERLSDGREPPEERAARVRRLFDLDLLILTLGAQGALAVSAAGEAVRVVPRPVADPVVLDPVGAGDGFTSVVILGLLHDWPLNDIMERAQDFASAIVTHQGATVDDRDFYTAFTRQWGIR